jgi:dTDP-4-dehydrorhamnose 3,5-epimerase
MQVRETDLPGVLIIEPRVFGDDRGFFLETFAAQRYAEHGLVEPFVQDNWSYSRRGILRGLHYQVQQSQGKLVQVIKGEIFDAAVDMRRDSPAFGKWVGAHLSCENKHQIWVPPGFAHGFLVLSEEAGVIYKCTDYYAPEHERSLLWNDPTIGVEWPYDGEPVLSEKDRNGLPFEQAECYDTSP